MTDVSSAAIGQKITFNTYGPINSVSSFTGEKVGIVSGKYLPLPEAALAHHSTIYPMLPDAVKSVTDDNYKSYNYLQLIKDTGDMVYVGIPWIQAATVIEIVPRIATIVLTNVTDTTPTRLRAELEQNGRKVTSITFS